MTDRLSPAALSVLGEWFMTAEQADARGLCKVSNEQGQRAFYISTGIPASDLSNLLTYANRMHNEGISIGKAGVKAALRDLIGAAEQPQESPL